MSVNKIKSKVALLGLTFYPYPEAIPESIKIFKEHLVHYGEILSGIAEVEKQYFCADAEDCEKAIAETANGEIEALVLVAVSYAASMTFVPSLLKSTLPLLVWNTQMDNSFGLAYDFDDLLRNHTVQGTQDMTSVLKRKNKIFALETGHCRDNKCLERMQKWLQAAKAANFAKKLRIGCMGSLCRDMGDFDLDDQMLKQWGPEKFRIDLEEFAKFANQATEDEIKKIIAADKASFDLSPGLREETHRLSVRYEIALRNIISKGEFQAFTMNFLELCNSPEIRSIPFLGINKLMGEGIGYGAEGDFVTAAFMAQINQLVEKSTFTEIYTVDFVKDRLMMSHMQECNPALARKDRKVKIVEKEFWAPGAENYAGMHFSLEPGPVTLASLTWEEVGKFNIIAYQCEIVDQEPLENFNIPHWVVRVPEQPVADFLNNYSLAGGPHHLVGIPGHHSDLLSKLAFWQNFNFTDLNNG
ncbi:MAG: hypothetical protein A2X48_13040 [Lentisphaerae bacterium GWF2_49_21]|nr:MAG: hypothetical protein A2X48_13040 [Lentisphaerae bacterium GWF2_49_21]